MSFRRLILLAIGCVLAADPAAALTVARLGETELRLVLADDAIPAERTAAEELSFYLNRVTSARFPIVLESAVDGDGPAIWVGPTAASRRLTRRREASTNLRMP